MYLHLLVVFSAFGSPFSSFRVRKIILPNPQKALKFSRAKALKESGSIERASVCSLSVTFRLN
jgi:hypothetical protein